MLRHYFILFIGILIIHLGAVGRADIYREKIQPLFNARCIACHSCFNAPCQLNLQSYEGFRRGATKLGVYDGFRLQSVAPTRMFVDAKTTEAWFKKGFYPVSDTKRSKENLFLEMLRIRQQHAEHFTSKSVESSLTCAKDIEDTKILGITDPRLGMPYGFPAISKEEFQMLEDWIANGAPGPKEKVKISDSLSKQVSTWEEFFNTKSPEGQLVARYMYEHLFLAHLHFKDEALQYFRLVRSSKECSLAVEEIPSRRPNDDPGVKKFYYCFKLVDYPVVFKTHMPLELSAKKLQLWKDIFFQQSVWKVTQLPSYSPEVAQNPFVAFADIPQRAKYKFLLSEAHYQVNTFIKGPVCNGTNAVNSIQEQFYTFFISPDSIPLSETKSLKPAQQLLVLPGSYGSDVDVVGVSGISDKIQDLREGYRKLRLQWLKENKPKGLGIEDIWDGDGDNNNAVLTIFRHNDNATVMKGAIGNLPKTIFVLDYSLLERLVYNLVVNFDVFGNVGHQLLTRVYMDYIRMEAEENFLLLLPAEQRQHYRNAWYQGILTEAKMKYIFPDLSLGQPTAVKFSEKGNYKAQVLNQLLANFKDPVRGLGDSLNWRALRPPNMPMEKLNAEEKLLKGLVSVRSQGSLPFARYFPETAYLIVREQGKIQSVYSIMHNREFQNVSWILAESLRRSPHEDTLVIRKGFWIAYPELIFEVESKNIKNFVMDIRNIENIFEYPAIEKKYSVAATAKNFWQVWDDLHQFMQQQDPVDFGYLDLTRYQR